MSGETDWRWADPTGQQRLIRLDELRAALSSGIIAPNAPVWRAGWNEWQPAYAVPELTTSALAAANGVVPNIPPPPLEMVSVQHAYEGEPFAVPHSQHEPPMPPSYVPTLTHAQQIASAPPPAVVPSPDETARVTAAMAPMPRTPSVSPAPPPTSPIAVPDDEANTEVVGAMSAERAEALLSPHAHAQDATPIGGIGVDAAPVPSRPPSAVIASPPAALPGSFSALAGSPSPPSFAPRPDSTSPRPPSVMPRTQSMSQPPPPPSKRPPVPRDAIEELSGSFIVPEDSPADDPQELSDSLLIPEQTSAPVAVAPTLVGPPPQRSRMSSTPPPPISYVPPVSPPKGSTPPADPSAPVILSESVRIASSPPTSGHGGGHGHVNTLLGMPIPGASRTPPPPQFAAFNRSVPHAEGSSQDPTLQIEKVSSERLHDLTALLRSRSKFAIPLVVVGGLVVAIGIVGLVFAIFHKKPSDEPTPYTSASSPSNTTTTTPSALASTTATASAHAATSATSANANSAPASRCVLAGGGHVIAPRANVPSGIEATAFGANVALGFAITPRDAMAVEVAPNSLAVISSARAKGDAIRRAVPIERSGKLTVIAEVDHKSDPVQTRRAIGTDAKFDLGVSEGWIVAAPHATNLTHRLFPLDGTGAIEVLRAAPITSATGEKGWAIAFRRTGAIWIGAAFGDDQLDARGPLIRIAGLGGQLGSPTIASVGNIAFVAWADRAGSADPWGVRWLRWVVGERASDATSFTPPPGGPGSEVISPSLRTIDAHRVLMAWTEGPTAAHQVRAQTWGADGVPIGDAINVSGDSTNAGQAQAVIAADGRGVVAYFAGTKGKTYELQASPIDCSSH